MDKEKAGHLVHLSKSLVLAKLSSIPLCLASLGPEPSRQALSHVASIDART